ncbi:MAG: hypothetical protein QM718_10005 [Steroidobacteraceae bacterium]
MNRAALRAFFLSLRGHLVMLGLPLFVICSAWMLQKAHDEQWLTPESGFKIVVSFIAAAIVTSAAVWYLVIRPVVRAQGYGGQK